MAPYVPQRLPIIEHQQGTKQQQWKFADDGRLISVTASPGSKRPNKASVGLRQLLASAFLPVGYPSSVTADYKGRLLWRPQAVFCGCNPAALELETRCTEKNKRDLKDIRVLMVQITSSGTLCKPLAATSEVCCPRMLCSRVLGLAAR